MDSFVKVDPEREPLSKADTNKAVKEMCVNRERFVKSNSAFKDPVDCEATYYIFSFIKNPEIENAISDETLRNKPWGIIKVRGAYSTAEECASRARFILQNVDSAHLIHTARVGIPYPLVDGGRYAYEREDVNIEETTDDILRKKAKEQRRKEKETIEELKSREKQLLEDVDPQKIKEPQEIYTELRVKWAQLKSVRDQHNDKLKEIEISLQRTKEEIRLADSEHPECREKYMALYLKARKDVGLESDEDLLNKQVSFMKYMRDPEIDNVAIEQHQPVVEPVVERIV